MQQLEAAKIDHRRKHGARLRKATIAVLCLSLLYPFASGAKQTPWATPYSLSETVTNGDEFMGVRLLGTLILPTDPIYGLPLVELSALAWDEDQGVLYILSDHGNLFHFRPHFRNGLLVDLEPLAAYPLRDPEGRPYRGKLADSEGMAIRNADNGRQGDSELVISFERRPRILRFDPRGGFLGREPLAAELRERSAYRSGNKALEAVAIHPRWGVLTAPEWPLVGEGLDAYPLFDAQGLRWRLPRFPKPNSGLVAMEVLPDGGLLTLERSFVSLWQPLYIVLGRTEPLTDGPPGRRLQSCEVAVFDTGKGWFMDNFEGLAHHRGKRYFMVSDDNQRGIQLSLLVYFQLIGEAAAPCPGKAR